MTGDINVVDLQGFINTYFSRRPLKGLWNENLKVVVDSGVYTNLYGTKKNHILRFSQLLRELVHLLQILVVDFKGDSFNMKDLYLFSLLS